MLKRDFIMVQIEEISKMIVQLVLDRNDGNDGAGEKKAEDLISTIYGTLKTDLKFLLSHAPADIRTALDYEDSCGLERMELAAKTMIEESHYRDNPSVILQKAYDIIEYVQMNDSTFSIERMQILNELQVKLNGSCNKS